MFFKGRVARAGRSGIAYCLVSNDEVPFVLDLHLFLGRPLKMATKDSVASDDGCYGRVPQVVVDSEMEDVKKFLENTDLVRCEIWKYLFHNAR